MDKNDYLEYWTALKAEIAAFGEIDDCGVIFGSKVRGSGHGYRILPVVPENELAEFESRTGLDLPLEYRTYLQAFGAGGAGPNYGIHDFHKNVQHKVFADPFPLTETAYEEDYGDDDPVWDLPGLAYICSRGCGIEHSIELNGPNPGRIWCESAGVICNCGSFHNFYCVWADETRIRLKNFDLLKTIVDRKPWTDTPKRIPLKEIAAIMGSEPRELHPREYSYIPEREIWVYFQDAPGKIILNEKQELISIEPSMMS